MRRAAGAALDATDEEQANWSLQLRAQRARLLLSWRHLWLRAVVPERPSAATLRRLRAARTAFYARYVPDAVLAVMRYGEHPTDDDLTDLLCQRYFRPTEDWRLFEVVVALRLARAFAIRSPHERRARLLTGVGTAPYGRYLLPDGDEVRLYYQKWPSTSGDSLHALTRARHQLHAGPPRPDLFVTRIGQHPDAALLELKASRDGRYLGQGLSQLLGYLKERPAAFEVQPSGWLVAPASPAFIPAAPDEAELWMVTADDVAEAAVNRFAAL